MIINYLLRNCLPKQKKSLFQFSAELDELPQTLLFHQIGILVKTLLCYSSIYPKVLKILYNPILSAMRKATIMFLWSILPTLQRVNSEFTSGLILRSHHHTGPFHQILCMTIYKYNAIHLYIYKYISM